MMVKTSNKLVGLIPNNIYTEDDVELEQVEVDLVPK